MLSSSFFFPSSDFRVEFFHFLINFRLLTASDVFFFCKKINFQLIFHHKHFSTFTEGNLDLKFSTESSMDASRKFCSHYPTHSKLFPRFFRRKACTAEQQHNRKFVQNQRKRSASLVIDFVAEIDNKELRKQS
ncbi:hypothetical protein B9Z55_003425 [Caenorhabditis nigoni]|uniref:Uncharacterized protein n=1 Tax=Caenorhabditis nigoni TaxID=1611254 RepID=A0A2G5VQB1_9PELO|nr:hypothetical protein B9Z55_003425 [Caenorhabditis nigoni]